MIEKSCQPELKIETGPRDERHLVEPFRRGDPRAFEQIVGLYMTDIHRLALRLLGWPADVDDLVQDVFTAAWRHRRRFRADCALKSWLFTITINRSRSWRRRRMLRDRFLQSRVDRVAQADRPPPVADFGPVQKAVRDLPEKYRRVIVLRYLEDLDTGEIATILDLSPAALNTRLSRARRRLKEALKDWEQKI